jgi:hypothetical protein
VPDWQRSFGVSYAVNLATGVFRRPTRTSADLWANCVPLHEEGSLSWISIAERSRHHYPMGAQIRLARGRKDVNG